MINTFQKFVNKNPPKRGRIVIETETDMFKEVYRVSSRTVGSKIYHSSDACEKLKRTGRKIIKGRLGSVIAGGYKKHC